jgi:hypothetical protein
VCEKTVGENLLLLRVADVGEESSCAADVDGVCHIFVPDLDEVNGEADTDDDSDVESSDCEDEDREEGSKTPELDEAMCGVIDMDPCDCEEDDVYRTVKANMQCSNAIQRGIGGVNMCEIDDGKLSSVWSASIREFEENPSEFISGGGSSRAASIAEDIECIAALLSRCDRDEMRQLLTKLAYICSRIVTCSKIKEMTRMMQKIVAVVLDKYASTFQEDDNMTLFDFYKLLNAKDGTGEFVLSKPNLREMVEVARNYVKIFRFKNIVNAELHVQSYGVETNVEKNTVKLTKIPDMALNDLAVFKEHLEQGTQKAAMDLTVSFKGERLLVSYFVQPEDVLCDPSSGTLYLKYAPGGADPEIDDGAQPGAATPTEVSTDDSKPDEARA